MKTCKNLLSERSRGGSLILLEGSRVPSGAFSVRFDSRTAADPEFHWNGGNREVLCWFRL